MTGFASSTCIQTRNWIVGVISAFALGACGGGNNGGIASGPLPARGQAYDISAPARATSGNGPATVLATPDGQNFATGPAPDTKFPLLQTILLWDLEGLVPSTYEMDNGGSLSVEEGQFTASFPYESSEWSTVPVIGGDDLDWARVGYWDYYGGWEDFSSAGFFIAGYETPAANIPATGSATYNGEAEGMVYYPMNEGTAEAQLSGNASLTADFGAGSVTGSLTELRIGSDAPWNDVTFTSNIAGNSFSGDTRVTSVPDDGYQTLSVGATGTIEGKFFGPAAEEAAAVWTLYDGTRSAIGTLSGSQP